MLEDWVHFQKGFLKTAFKSFKGSYTGDKVFNSGLSTFCGGIGVCLRQNLLSPLSNTLSQVYILKVFIEFDLYCPKLLFY